MVLGGRVEITVRFDNIYEAADWVESEYRGFKKSALLIFEFNNPTDMLNALGVFSDSFRIGTRFYIPIDVPELFLDTANDLVEKVKEFGGIIVEAKVTAINYADSVEKLDDLFNDVRREIELWNFSRAIDSLPKARV